MKLLNQEELLAIGRIVKEKCPNCMQIVSPDCFQIHFQNLPEKIFDEILLFIEDMRKEQTRQPMVN